MFVKFLYCMLYYYFEVREDKYICLYIHIHFFFGLFAFSRATPTAHGGSQARGLNGAVATGLHHSHSHVGSEPCLQPIPQLTAMLAPQPPEQSQGSNHILMDTSGIHFR